MTARKISLEALQKVRQRLRNALTLPESENRPRSWSSYDEADEMSAPESVGELGDLFNFGNPLQEVTYAPNTRGQWFISSINPGAALIALPGLRLRQGLRLVCYLQRTQDSGIGMTWAVPEHLSTTQQLEQTLKQHGNPHPTGALEDVMLAMEGDRDPGSFLLASLLRRELRELGSIGKSCRWSHQRLITDLPHSALWQWRVPVPKDLSPKVQVLPSGEAAVEFFTCRTIPPFAIFHHFDQYVPGHYKAVGLNRAIALIQC